MEFCYRRRKRVSKHFLAIKWRRRPSLNSLSQLELLSIRMALFFKETHVPPDQHSPPLLIAYNIYVIALIRQGFPHEHTFETESDDDSTPPITLSATVEKWLELAFTQTAKVRPREAGYTLKNAVWLAGDSYIRGTYRLAILP
jgi:hypothetical protein